VNLRKLRPSAYFRWLDIARQSAEKLYGILCTTWGCACPSPHGIDLILEFDHEAHDSSKDITFKIDFETQQLAAQATRRYVSTIIKLLKEPAPAPTPHVDHLTIVSTNLKAIKISKR
jgi:hypothetical protein